MVRRDRNHPCVVMRGLLNETRDGPMFRHAVQSLALVRRLDPTRVVMLDSGRGYKRIPVPYGGLEVWRSRERGPLPSIAHNGTDHTVRFLPGITWKPGALTAHPGPAGE